MTPHPDFAPMDMSIQQALRKMHDGHYLNLPVMNKESDEIVGMVDVLKLTYATLDQINGMSTGDNEGPAWNKFWMSMENETESMMSGEGGSHAPQTPDGRSNMMSPEMGHRIGHMERGDSVLPNDSASHTGAPDQDQSAMAGAVEDTPFTFKFKAPGGRVHRLQVVASAGLAELITDVGNKLGNEAESIGGIPTFENGTLGHAGFALSYMDNEGDTVSITTDYDLLEAITLARTARKDKVDLFVHDPEKPALSATVDPQPAIIPATPPTESVRRRKVDDDEEEDEEEAQAAADRRRERKAAAAQPAKQEQIIQGVPNEALLPGAIVVLGAVILITFVVGRSSR
jgi:hypothetical protein